MSIGSNRNSSSSPIRAWCALAAVALLGAAACHSGVVVAIPVDSKPQTITAAVGSELDVTLANFGPGEYAAPPGMSSNVLTYLGVEAAAAYPPPDPTQPYLPAGPSQRFRFRAATPGRTFVDFQRMLGDSVIAVVEDTVVVQ